VDEDQGDRLVEQLHELLIRPVPGDKVLGPTWQQLFSQPRDPAGGSVPWWRSKRTQLLEALGEHEAAFVYDLEAVRAAARSLRALGSLARVHYSMKANPHPQLLRTLRAEGIEFECVSRGEVERVLELFPDLDRERILYTPNFAPRAEVAWALSAGVRVTVDNSYALSEWPQLFRAHEIFVRVDSGVGRGHHTHVRTAGTRSKFGVPIAELSEVARRGHDAGARVVGLQAHVVSGVFDVTSWEHTARLLAAAAPGFAQLRVIDVGGGLGVPESPDQPGVDLARLDTLLLAVRAEHPQLEVWLEPGRYLVAAARVLLARLAPLELYTGLALPPAQLEQELQRLHYRRAERPEHPGTYRVAGARFDVALRPARFADETRNAQLLSIVAGSQGLESLRDSAGRDVPVLRLEPLLIGSIFPIHGEDRIIVTPQEVPTLLPAALKAVEDRKFDSHHGVDPIAMLRALWVDVRARQIEQGGSTLTQQLVRSYFLSSRQTLSRKVREAIMAMALDAHFTKADL